MTGCRKYVFTYLKTFIDEDKIITSKDAYLTRNTVIDFNCMKCNEVTSKGFRFIAKSGGPYCKPCTNLIKKDKYTKTVQKLYGVDHVSQAKSIKEKKRVTTMKNHGVENPLQSKEIRDKIKATNLKRFGVSYSLQAKEVRDKIKQTNIQKYGVENPFQSEEIKDKIKATNFKNFGVSYSLQAKEVRDKIKATNLEKFGYDNPFQSEEIKDKIKQTNIQKYGVENPFQSEEIKDKLKLTNLDKYGCEYGLQSQQIKDKIKATNLEKYGTEHHMQNSNIAEYCSSKCYSTKIYTFPSGNDAIVQGYEHFALDILLKTYQEEDFILKRTDMPEIWYFNSEQPSKIRRYFPDIYIPKDNLIIEIKSTWTFEKNKSEVFDKKKATQYLGYNYEIWIISPKGEIIQKYDKKQIVYKLPVLQQ
jgi:hypothetical protein